MKLKDIFRMEMYKNRNNKPYLLVIAILTVMAATSTFLGISMEIRMPLGNFFTMLMIFTVLGVAVLSLLYPFHLLNVDYRNKVMSLIFASGISREKYYFVKIGATILTCFIATLVILFIPAITYLVVYPEEFVKVMREFIENFALLNIAPFVLKAIFALFAYFVTLTTAVIITKGKVSGIFLFIGFYFAVSLFRSIVTLPFAYASVFSENYSVNSSFYVATAFSIIQIVVFALIGLAVLRKQDL